LLQLDFNPKDIQIRCHYCGKIKHNSLVSRKGLRPICDDCSDKRKIKKKFLKVKDNKQGLPIRLWF